MDITTIALKRPDVQIRMTSDEADDLQSMLYEARAYASDCGDSVEDHDKVIALLELVIGE